MIFGMGRGFNFPIAFTVYQNHLLNNLNNMVYHICYILYVFIKPLRYYEKTSCNLLGESIFHNNIKGRNFTGKG